MNQDIWLDIQHELAAVLNGYVNLQDERVAEATVQALRHNAERRGRNALVVNSGTEAQYHTDVKYHYVVDVLVKTIVAGVFGENPLTADEKAVREQSLKTVINALDKLWP